MPNQPPSRTADKIMVRLPDGMRDRLMEAAKGKGRSVNAEVVARLEASFEADDTVREQAEQIEELISFTSELDKRLAHVEIRLDDSLGDYR